MSSRGRKKLFVADAKQRRIDQFYTSQGTQINRSQMKRKSPDTMEENIQQEETAKKSKNDEAYFSPEDDEILSQMDLSSANDDLNTSVLKDSNAPNTQVTTTPLTPSKSQNRPSRKTAVSVTPQKFRTPRKQDNSPAKTPGSSSYSPRKKTPLKKLHKWRGIDEDLTKKATENLSHARQGAIAPNDFRLSDVYAIDNFEFHQHSSIDANAAVAFELNDVNYPGETHALSLFNIVVEVFSNPINCGYFNHTELDMIFSILTMSTEAQMLFARMIKRKLSWHRVKALNYPEVADDLLPVIKELVSVGLCTMDVKEEDMEVMLNLLQVDGIKNLCKKQKIDPKGAKPVLVEKILKSVKVKKSLFPGAKTPQEALREAINRELGDCFCINEKAINLVDRIIILLIPMFDVRSTISNLFLMLMEMRNGKVVYPVASFKPMPIFTSRQHLLDYVAARKVLVNTYGAIDEKEWDTVRENGRLAYTNLKDYLHELNERSDLGEIPAHVKKYDPKSAWVKVLSKSIDSFKKSKEITEACKYLNFLIEEIKYGQKLKGSWYSELALIEMHYNKNLDNSSDLIVRALSEKFNEVNLKDLLDRAQKLLKHSKLSENSRLNLNTAMSNMEKIPEPKVNVEIVKADMMIIDQSRGKSVWKFGDGESTDYLNVESIALEHYSSKGYTRGIHCEGSFPVLLFSVMFWEELYKVHVPGAFVSSYQSAPADLYTSCFYNNRSEAIEKKTDFFKSLPLDEFVELMGDSYEKNQHYQSVMPPNIFSNIVDFQTVVRCLGIKGVIAICERIAEDFIVWRAGFPDLFVWNPTTLECKIVEVKGPRDTLSTKQKLWLDYLNSVDVKTELCLVQDKKCGN